MECISVRERSCLACRYFVYAMIQIPPSGGSPLTGGTVRRHLSSPRLTDLPLDRRCPVFAGVNAAEAYRRIIIELVQSKRIGDAAAAVQSGCSAKSGSRATAAVSVLDARGRNRPFQRSPMRLSFGMPRGACKRTTSRRLFEALDLGGSGQWSRLAVPGKAAAPEIRRAPGW